VTEIGQRYYARCRAMVVEAEAAQEALEPTRAEPCGIVRITCPVALLDARIGAMLAEFLAGHPRVEVHLEATHRRADVVSEAVNVAIGVRPPPLQDSDLATRVLAERGQYLVASPSLLERLGPPQVPADLADLPCLDHGAPQQQIAPAVFVSRCGLLPAVRALIDFLAERFEKLDED
jgi:DNA-binding transcriptional LysR family regulator